ncbi:MAG: 5-(carboxyamino)imidazole ribonucleotide mutase [Actinomycetales bacterium]|jgi:5-(carboxyamino)imidazole ribonucleotide mutase|nr:5-(carboxyamino)imidazole ribonucleotide mutase [Actinomycetales bacterium]
MSSEKFSVAVCMGSDSDWPVMRAATEILSELGITNKAFVLSAHRMPLEMTAFAQSARNNGFNVIIAGAGGAAHLPGMMAALTTLPVIGVPVSATALDGMDSLLSIVQMPAGIPVATVAIDNSKNAGLLAARILGVGDPGLAARLESYARELNAQAAAKQSNLP